jgi:hypothetical protein
MSWSQLPYENKFEILFKISASSLLKTCSVNKSFDELCSDEKFSLGQVPKGGGKHTLWLITMKGTSSTKRIL